MSKQTRSTGVTTLVGNKQSLVLLIITLVVLIGLFFIAKTYKDLSGETIIIEDETDVEVAKENIQEHLQSLNQDKEALKTLIT